jgi:hypothetical protein
MNRKTFLGVLLGGLAACFGIRKAKTISFEKRRGLFIMVAGVPVWADPYVPDGDVFCLPYKSDARWIRLSDYQWDQNQTERIKVLLCIVSYTKHTGKIPEFCVINNNHWLRLSQCPC